MKFISLLIALLCYSSTILAAGGTMVGNGGGFAEMQAVHLDALLPMYLKDQIEHQEFLLFLNNDDRPALGFEKLCLPLNHSELKPEVIPSCHLYSDQDSELGPRPLDARRIGAIVFAIRWMAFQSTDSWDTALAKGLSIYSSTEIEIDSIPVTWQSRVVASLNVWNVSAEENIQPSQQITLELPEVSLDAKSLIQRASGCQASEFLIDVAFLSPKTFQQSRLTAMGPMQWSCGSEAFRGELHLSYSHKNETPQLKASLRKIRNQEADF